MPRGGSRPGAGRPRKDPDERVTRVKKDLKEAEGNARKYARVMDFLLDALGDPEVPIEVKKQLTIAALPFELPKLAEVQVGKKGAAQSRGEEVARGKFRPSAPPGSKTMQ